PSPAATAPGNATAPSSAAPTAASYPTATPRPSASPDARPRRPPIPPRSAGLDRHRLDLLDHHLLHLQPDHRTPLRHPHDPVRLGAAHPAHPRAHRPLHAHRPVLPRGPLPLPPPPRAAHAPSPPRRGHIPRGPRLPHGPTDPRCRPPDLHGLGRRHP